MSDEYIPYLFLGIFVMFPFFWFGIIRFLMKKAKMSKELDVGKFEIIKTSSWGTGIVNGVSVKNCLRVINTEKGYILETQKLLGGRKLWLPKEGLDIGPLVSKTLLKPKRITLTSNEHSILLLGNLANEII